MNKLLGTIVFLSLFVFSHTYANNKLEENKSVYNIMSMEEKEVLRIKKIEELKDQLEEEERRKLENENKRIAKEKFKKIEEKNQRIAKEKLKELEEENQRLAQEKLKEIKLQEDIKKIKEEISLINQKTNNNILLKRYSNYIAYRKISKELSLIKKDLKINKNKSEDELYNINNTIRIKQNELELINEYKGSPIGALIDPPEIEEYEEITNPFGIINALSFIKKLQNNKQQYISVGKNILTLSELIDKKLFLYLDLYTLEENIVHQKEISLLDNKQKDFHMVLEIVSTTEEVYTRKIEQVILETKSKISDQIEKIFYILFIIFILFVINFLIKMTLKRYFSQTESYYMTNKVLNFLFVFLTIMILLFSYIDNVSYIVTILGFASAGIAIALKDWFMSIFGWMVIVTSGSIQVGDRIKVTRGGVEAVGDVLDISLFKITIREDITYTSYVTNRRTGRIFFIPNNYIFSEMIANYTHAGLRTVWDGIDIAITFDSNYRKAQEISRKILKHYSKGYTDITRKQLSKMRSKYQLRVTGVEPRVYTFVEPHAIIISSWYLTNSYAALVLRSTISPEILEAFMKEDDIHIAYPTQSINFTHKREKPVDLPDVDEK